MGTDTPLRPAGPDADAVSTASVVTSDGAMIEPIVCGSCQRILPGDSRYCPYCCGEDGRRGAMQGAIFLGAVLGVLAGGLLTAVWSSAIGAEQTRWSDVLATLATCITIGVAIGVFRTLRLRRKG
ncbi:zinc ribbon domain-containing protein [Accumulibacter sp.]|uniref:zinc ribbon domain-containing protein n=1 Tax=Accumulibacter sp. TaxID=2053492 RepID=UPI002C0F945E|nr:zinc ribbon domain-containing protein [Accumulibacter sp.]HRF04404.1 zinc ribbon domain-containing protein [Accumulibacter sp.]